MCKTMRIFRQGKKGKQRNRNAISILSGAAVAEKARVLHRFDFSIHLETVSYRQHAFVARETAVCPLRRILIGGISVDEMARLIEILKDVNEDVDFERETALVDEGIIDSFDIVAMISALDEAYQIRIPIKDIGPENFNSVQTIMETVKRYVRPL